MRVIACLIVVALAGCAGAPVEVADVVQPEAIEPVLEQRPLAAPQPDLAWCPSSLWGCISMTSGGTSNYVDIGFNETARGLSVEVTAPDRMMAEVQLDVVCYGPCGEWIDYSELGTPPLSFEWNGTATDGASFGAFVTWFRPEPHGSDLSETWTLTGHVDVLVYPKEDGTTGPNRPR